MEEIKNWKLKEVINQIEVIDNDSVKFVHSILKQLNISESKELTGIIRSETIIDWDKMNHHKFFFDYQGEEGEIMKALNSSELVKHKNVIITYGWNEPVIKISMDLFIKDWEGFFRSTHFETCIFSEDYSLILEVSRDYYLHSNFYIMGD